MRLTILLAIMAMVAWVGASPVKSSHSRNPIERSLIEERLHRESSLQDVKGRKTVHKHHNTQATANPEFNLRKGEYMCGNRVCKLLPGEVPAGCNGVCQHRV